MGQLRGEGRDPHIDLIAGLWVPVEGSAEDVGPCLHLHALQPRPPQCSVSLLPHPTPKQRPHLPSGHSDPPTALLGLGAPWLASCGEGGSQRPVPCTPPRPRFCPPQPGHYSCGRSASSPCLHGKGSLGRLSGTGRRVSVLILLPRSRGVRPHPRRPAPHYGPPPGGRTGPREHCGPVCGAGHRRGWAMVQIPGEPRGGPRWGAQASLADPSLCCGLPTQSEAVGL